MAVIIFSLFFYRSVYQIDMIVACKRLRLAGDFAELASAQRATDGHTLYFFLPDGRRNTLCP